MLCYIQSFITTANKHTNKQKANWCKPTGNKVSYITFDKQDGRNAVILYA